MPLQDCKKQVMAVKRNVRAGRAWMYCSRSQESLLHRGKEARACIFFDKIRRRWWSSSSLQELAVILARQLKLRKTPCTRKKGCLLQDGHRYPVARDRPSGGRVWLASIDRGCFAFDARPLPAARHLSKQQGVGKLVLAVKQVLLLVGGNRVRENLRSS